MVLGSCASPPSYGAVLGPEPIPAGPGLPDGRVYEQVSPSAKNGNQAGAGVGGVNAYGVASPSGERVLYWNSGPIGEASSGVDHFSVSTRSQSGWSTRAALPQPAPEPRDPVSSGDPIWLTASENLSSMAFTARDPFAPAEVDFENPEFSFDSTYVSSEGAPAIWIGKPTVANPLPELEAVGEPSNLVLVGASSDMSVVYYEYYGTLVPQDAPRRATVESGNVQAWGLYEWRGGQLKAAGLVPSGEGHEEEDEFGAVAAAVGVETLTARPVDFDNQVSRSGNTMLFISPSPGALSERPPQLYARVDGTKTVLISRSDLTGLPSSGGVDAVIGLSPSLISSYAYGSPDGSHVFFTSEDQLTSDAPADSSLKEYEFDLTTDTLTYRPEISAPILASSQDGSTLVFAAVAPTGEYELALSSEGHVTDITTLPLPSVGQLYAAPVSLTADGKTVVFQTDAAVPGFNNGGKFAEIYRFELATDRLSCLSCPPHGQSPTGSARMSVDDAAHTAFLTTDSRGISEDGSEVFFDTPDPLVPADTNKARDVYEWHDGLLSLISPGTTSGESVFLDNSASGNDVFFATTSGISSSDTDGAFDVYDARVGGGFPVSPAAACGGGCGGPPNQPAPAPSLASVEPQGAGEQVVPAPPARRPPPALSRAQRLAKSLKACKGKRGRSRHTCEARARRLYGRLPPSRRP
jgi:hypothetical protein